MGGGKRESLDILPVVNGEDSLPQLGYSRTVFTETAEIAER